MLNLVFLCHVKRIARNFNHKKLIVTRKMLIFRKHIDYCRFRTTSITNWHNIDV